jgi:hypothetical protein
MNDGKRLIMFLLLLVLSSCVNLCVLEDTVDIRAGRFQEASYPFGFDPEIPASLLDLDSGILGNPDEVDLWFAHGGGTAAIFPIITANGSLTKFMGFDEPGYEGCLSVIEEFTPGSVPNWREGGYICVLTNEGRLSQVKTEDFYFEGPNAMLRVSFITWRKIVDRKNE